MAAGGAKGETAAEAMRRAAVLEGQLARAAGGDDAGLRKECADAYLSCGRRMLREAGEAGGGAGEEAALECLEKAAAINGLWHACADACGQHARARQKAGEHAGAIAWLGRALSLADRAKDSETAKARKKRRALRDRCIDSWKELVRAPADDMDGPYRTALLADPSRAQTHIDMGYVLAGRGQAGRAAECYEGACEADPGSAEARFRAGTALQEAGEHGRAARRYEEAGRMNAGQAQRAAMGCAQCGRSMAAAGRRAEAAAALEAAARLDPSLALECARAHEECAGAAPRGGGGEAAGAQEEMPPQGAQYARAVEWYQRAGGGEAAAEAARGCARCGRALLERKRPAEAAACLDAAAGLDPAHSLECAAAHEEAAGAALREEEGGGGGSEAAAEHYNRAAEMYAGGAGAIGDARGCVRCGEALGRMGRPGEAARWIEAAANLDPAYAHKCAAAHERAGEAALQAEGGGRGRDAAAEHYARAAAWHGRRREGGREAAAEAAAGCARCGRLLGEMGRLGDAAAALDSAADMDPAHSLECARMHEGCAAEARSRRGGDAEEAAVHYREAARRYGAAGRGGGTEGAAARGCIECGRALGGMGRHVGAAEAFAGAAVLDPPAALECALACAGMAGEARESKGRGKRGDRGEILRLALQCCEAGRAGGAGGAELRIAAADIMLEQGRHAEAAAEYGRACAEDGSLRRRCAEGCVKCGDGLAGGSRAGEALACIRGAQEAGTVESAEVEEACVRWGRTMFDGARYGEAARCFEAGAAAAASAAAAAGGGGIAARLGLAASLSMDGRRAEAVRAYREAAGHGGAAALAGSAGGCAARLAIADALLGEGAHGEAEQWYARSRAGGTGAEISRAYAGIAGSLHSRSMHAAAHGCIAMAAAAGWPEDRAGTGRLCADIGRGLEEEGRLEQAAYCYAKAAGLDGGLKAECARACMRVGGEMEEAGMRDGAVECYEDAIRMVPGNHEAHFAVADAMVRGGNYNRAAWYYEAAGRHGGDGKRAGFGEAMCRARDLHERARDEVDMQKKRGMYRDAEWAYEAAAKLAPRSHEPRMGAGMACLKQRDDVENFRRAEAHFAEAIARAPPMVEPCMYAAKAVRKHAMGTRDRGRYRDALEYYRMAVKRRPRRPIVPRYWMGLCMLCAASGGVEDEERAKEFLRGALDGAEPATSEEMHFCGRMCDILGRHKEAAGHYLGSLKGSPLYSADFYKRIDADLIRTGSIPEGGAPAAANKGGRGGAGRPGSAEPQYVCDTNVVLAYLDHLARKTAFKSPIVPVLEKGMCAVPQVCYNEAHGKTAGSELSGWLAGTVGRMCTVIKGRGRMDTRMQMAREAFMAGWLYSSEGAIREWCKSADEKAAAKSTRYGGGPPSGRDVLVLATAIDMHVRQRRPSTVRLVTWDRDFGDFADYIRAEAGIEVVRPDDVGG